MPKWDTGTKQGPRGGAALRKRREKPPVADITPLPPKDARVPKAMTPPESLKLDPNPTPDGIRFEIENMGGINDYLLVLQNGGVVFGCKPTRHSGVVPVPDIGKRTGKWTGMLILDNRTVADTVEFEMNLTVEWLAEYLGDVTILFADSDGMIDRLGATRVEPWPKQDRVSIEQVHEDVVICILFPDLPDELPDPRPQFVFQIDRPRSGGIYYREEAPVARMGGFLMKVLNYLPCEETGDWMITVSLGSRVLGRATLRITSVGYLVPPELGLKTDSPVEEFAVSIVS